MIQDEIRKLTSYFIPKKGDSAVAGTIFPATNEGHNLGKAGQRFDTLYVREIVADVVPGGSSGGGGGDADSVDGLHATEDPQPGILLALDSSSQWPTSTYVQALLKDGSRALEGSLSVVGGATIDGIDVSEHVHSGAAGQGPKINHQDLLNNDADVHPQYTQRAQDEIVTGDWMFTHLLDRSAGWKFEPDNKRFLSVPHNLILYADEVKASIEMGQDVGGERALVFYDDASPTTYAKIGRGNESITLHATHASYRLWAGHSDPASALFRVEADGSIYAVDGEIAGWTILSDRIQSNDLELRASGKIYAGDFATTPNDSLTIDALHATWRMWIGNQDPNLAPFAVNKVGQLYMKDAYVAGTLRSQNYISGTSGFNLDSNGLAEFQNIIARGRLQTTVMTENAISVSSGSFVISEGAVLVEEVVPADTEIILDTDVFGADDIVHVKPDQDRDEWMRIGTTAIPVANGFKYGVVRGINSDESAYTGPYNYYAGEVVTRKGTATQARLAYPLSAGESGGELGEFQPAGSGGTSEGGYLVLEGQRGTGPYFGVIARYGPVYNQLLDVVRIGNLYGVLDYTEESWGAFFGDDNNFMVYDQTVGLRLQARDGSTQIGEEGVLTDLFSLTKLVSAPDYIDQRARIWFDSDGTTLRLKARMKDDLVEAEMNLTGLAVKSGTPTPAPDNVTTTFATGEPYVPNSLSVFLGGVAQIPGTDFTESNPTGGQFAMTVAPDSDLSLTVIYAVDTAVNYAVNQTSHGSLSDLGLDHHSQYVHKDVIRTITAQHNFAPTVSQAPFALGANAQGQLVTGLNADQLDGLDSTAFANANAEVGGFTWSVNSPVIGGIGGPRLPANVTAVKISAYVVGGTSVSFNVEERSTIGVAGTNMVGSEVVADADGVEVASFSNGGLAQDNWLWLDISAVSGAVEQLIISVRYTIDE